MLINRVTMLKVVKNMIEIFSFRDGHIRYYDFSSV